MDIITFNRAKNLRNEIEVWTKEKEYLRDVDERRKDELFDNILNLSRTAVDALIQSLEQQFDKL